MKVDLKTSISMPISVDINIFVKGDKRANDSR